jgi:hypothetical protein
MYPCSQAKLEKRARRDLYEGSKLLDAHKKQVLFISLLSISVRELIDGFAQQTYEEMFLKVRPAVPLICIARALLIRGITHVDQPTRGSKLTQQIQGYSSSFYRCQLWFKPHLVSSTPYLLCSLSKPLHSCLNYPPFLMSGPAPRLHLPTAVAMG